MSPDSRMNQKKLLIERRLNFLYQHLLISIPANIICATIVVAGIFKYIKPFELFLWYLATLIISLCRLVLKSWYRAKPKMIRFHFTLFVICTWLSACLWGIAVSLFMPANEFLAQLLLIVVTTGITSGGLQTLRASFVASFGYTIFSILPLIIWLALQKNPEYILVTLSAIAYFIFSIIIAWQGYQIILQNLSLQFQNLELLDDLTKSNSFLKTTNQALIESQRLFQSAFDFAAIGMALISIEGRWLKVNPPLCDLLGYTEKELLQTDFRSISYDEDQDIDLVLMNELLNDDIPSYHIEKRFIQHNGSLIWVMLSVSTVKDFKNEPIYLIAQIHNIQTQKKAERILEQIAFHDPLTNLGNRAQLVKATKQMIEDAKETKKKFAFIMLDLDHFKHINDTLGHDAGDELLKEVSITLKNTIRYTDQIMRLGGDEFVLLISDISDEMVIVHVAQKVLDVMLKPTLIKGHKVYTTASMGISVYPNDGSDLQTLMKNADICLYRAKNLGRNNFQFFTSEIQSSIKEKAMREQLLREALLGEEFQIYYQPKMNVADLKINGFEALLRWKSKLYGYISPDEIITLAEEMNLIDAMSKWIFKKVAEQIKIWHTSYPSSIAISINLSSREFFQLDFIDRVEDLLKMHEIPKFSLEFEINENVLMQDPIKNASIVQSLKNLGIQIAVDDFGTSYTSLNYLRKLAVDRIKIDRSFIKELVYNHNSRSIIKAIIALSTELGIKTVAVGVETKEQFDFLASNGCNEIQGYYISQPLTPDFANKFLENKFKAEQVTE